MLLLVGLRMIKYGGFAWGRSKFIFNILSTNSKLELFLVKLIEKGKLVTSTPTVSNICWEVRMSKFLPSEIEREAGRSTFYCCKFKCMPLTFPFNRSSKHKITSKPQQVVLWMQIIEILFKPASTERMFSDSPLSIMSSRPQLQFLSLPASALSFISGFIRMAASVLGIWLSPDDIRGRRGTIASGHFLLGVRLDFSRTPREGFTSRPIDQCWVTCLFLKPLRVKEGC